MKHSKVDKKRLEAQNGSVMKQYLNQAIEISDISDMFSLIDEKKPRIDVISDEFLRDIQNMNEKNLAVELLEKLLSNQIKARFKKDIISLKNIQFN